MSKPVITLLLLASIFFFNFLSRIIFSPALPQIMEDLHLSAATASQLFFAISAGYFLSLLGSGFVASRVKHRGAILLSSVILSIALGLTGISHSVTSLAGAMLLLGIGAGLYLPSGISTITGTFPQATWGRVLAVHEVAPNLAFLLAPLLATLFLFPFGWQQMGFILAAGTILLGILFWLSGAGDFRGEQPKFSVCKKYVSKREFWIMVLLFSLGVTATLGIFNILPLYLVKIHHFTKENANTLISISRIATLATALAGGMAVDRFGARRTISIVFLFSGTVTILLGLLSGSLVKVTVFLQPLSAVIFFPAAFAAMSRIAPKEERGILISIIVSLAFLQGAGAVPVAIGFLADHQLFRAGIIGAGILLIVGSFLALGLPSGKSEDE